MHCLTMLMMGPIADNMAMPAAVRERHERLRAAKFREVVEEGARSRRSRPGRPRLA
jgi:hypothetical protein